MITPISLVARLLAVLVVPPSVWWGVDTSPAIAVDKVDVVTPEVARGGNLKVRYHTTFYRRCSGKAMRYIEDAAGRPTEAAAYEFRDGIGRNGQPVPLDNPQWITVEATIPDAAPPGAALYQNVSDFYCNPLQRFLRRGVRFAYPLVHFEILNAHVAHAEPAVTAFRPVDTGYDLRERANAIVPEPSDLARKP